MSRLINDFVKRNLWGSSSNAPTGVLEPQRSDLWYVDFTNAFSGVTDVFDSVVNYIPPQMVQSVSLPENKVKVEPFRRDSRVYQMPSWDEPLETVRMTFLLDTSSAGVSGIYQFLNNWLELCRAGRGFRSSGYGLNARGEDPLLLDENFQSNYRFDCALYFVRGNNQGASATSLFSDLEVWQTVMLQQMWIAGLKISDLNYTTNALTTVEASFYVESIDWLTPP
jgi:hypothetical protein